VLLLALAGKHVFASVAAFFSPNSKVLPFKIVAAGETLQTASSPMFLGNAPVTAPQKV
jgi:hypothetical protein